MRAVDIIIKKRDKLELSPQEIHFFIKGIVDGQIPDYQASAWAMAVLLNGMTKKEIIDLTLAMANSGHVLDLADMGVLVVDKHSTGGVGDKTSLVVAPLSAACGIKIGKMSGRGLGFSGGTLDKLDSIPGFRSDLSEKEFRSQLNEIGLVLTGQTSELAPADGILYALRDVTGTVPSFCLIASSVMSKKIASGANAIVLDVKTGLGAFMRNKEDAIHLAEIMVQIGKGINKSMTAVVSDMNQPLGCAVGNALELKEALETLQGRGPDDFRKHCLLLASYMVLLGKGTDTFEHAQELVCKALEEGKGYEKFKQFISAQGGDTDVLDHPERLPKAKLIKNVKADRSGYIKQLHARIIGEAAVELGAGRAKKTDPIDLAVGFKFHKKVGDLVHGDDLLFTVYANDKVKLDRAVKDVWGAYEWSDDRCEPYPLHYKILT